MAAELIIYNVFNALSIVDNTFPLFRFLPTKLRFREGSTRFPGTVFFPSFSLSASIIRRDIVVKRKNNYGNSSVTYSGGRDILRIRLSPYVLTMIHLLSKFNADQFGTWKIKTKKNQRTNPWWYGTFPKEGVLGNNGKPVRVIVVNRVVDRYLMCKNYFWNQPMARHQSIARDTTMSRSLFI